MSCVLIFYFLLILDILKKVKKSVKYLIFILFYYVIIGYEKGLFVF